MPLTTILATDLVTNSRAVINANFTYVEGLVLAYTKLVPSVGLMTLYDDTATTGVTTLTVRAGAGQSTTNLQEWKNAAGAVMARIISVGQIYGYGFDSGGGVRVLNGDVPGLQIGDTNRIYWGGRLSLYSTSTATLAFNGVTNSSPALSVGAINGFTIRSAAETSTFNDAVTAASGTLALRKIFDIDTPTLTATNASVAYTQTCTLHVGLPVASTNITFSNVAKSILADGPIDAQKFYVGGVVGYNGSITLVGTLSIQVAYGIITGIT